MTDQLNKQHENLTCDCLTGTNPILEVEKGTAIRVLRGSGKWLDKPVRVICVELQTPYFCATLTLCEGEDSYDFLDYCVLNDMGQDDLAETLASLVLGRFSLKETLSMMHRAHGVGIEDGRVILSNDIKRLLRI